MWSALYAFPIGIDNNFVGPRFPFYCDSEKILFCLSYYKNYGLLINVSE